MTATIARPPVTVGAAPAASGVTPPPALPLSFLGAAGVGLRGLARHLDVEWSPSERTLAPPAR